MKIPFQESSKELIFRNMYESYYAPLCIFAKRYIDDICICEDIVSDVFAALWSKKEDFELRSETSIAYLRMAVRNSCLNHIKHLNYELDYAAMCNERAPLYANSPESIYTLEELYGLLHKTLDKLPENYRAVFIKCFFEGKTHAQIAEELNLSVKSIDRYKKKTLDLLRNDLKEFLPIAMIVLEQTLEVCSNINSN